MNGYIARVADEIADLLLREGIDYVQSKAVFRAARIKAGLHAPKETRNAPARLTLEEQLRFIDAAYARNGRIGLMVQTLLETGARVSEFVALRVQDVSLAERTIAVESAKGGKRREIPIRAELARLLAMHIGNRRAGPLFLSRQKARTGARMYTRQRIGQMVREVARDAGIGKRIYPGRSVHHVAVLGEHGVRSGRGRNPTLRVCPMPSDDVTDGVLADPEVAGDPAVAPPAVDGIEHLRSEAV